MALSPCGSFSGFPGGGIAGRIAGAMSDSASRPARKGRTEYLTPPLVRPSKAGRKFGLGEHWQQAYVQAQMAIRHGPLDGRQVLLGAVRAADDPDHAWPALGLLRALGLPNRTLFALQRRLGETYTNDLTLRELMDAVMLEGGATTINGQTSGLLAISGVGKQGIVALATALTKLDLGRQCNALWFQRVANLKGPWASIPAARPPDGS